MGGSFAVFSFSFRTCTFFDFGTATLRPHLAKLSDINKDKLKYAIEIELRKKVIRSMDRSIEFLLKLQRSINKPSQAALAVPQKVR